jgi:hypothetical protein
MITLRLEAVVNMQRINAKGDLIIFSEYCQQLQPGTGTVDNSGEASFLSVNSSFLSLQGGFRKY